MERGLYPLFQPCKRIPRCINQGTEEVQQLMRLFVISREKKEECRVEKSGMAIATTRYEGDHKGSPLLWTGPVYTLYTLHPVIR